MKERLKNPGLNGIRTHDLFDTGAVLNQLSYQAHWELAIFVQAWIFSGFPSLLNNIIRLKKLKNDKKL